MYVVVRLAVWAKIGENEERLISRGRAFTSLSLSRPEQPQSFSLTMTSRTYLWRTERASDQSHFLNTILRIYEKFTQGRRPQLVNFDVNEQHPHGEPVSFNTPLATA
jgi:hypothetical protein